MKPGPFVLDNSVLSALYRQDWLSGLTVHRNDRRIVTPEMVWESEFKTRFDPGEIEWIEVETSTQFPFLERPTSLSEADLACLGLAEKHDGTVIVNDKKVVRTAEARGTSVYWGTEFVIKTFELCGMSQDEFDSGKEGYAEDVYLSDQARQQLFQARKP